MNYKTFGRTGYSVSEVSMGCNRLGDPGTETADWAPLIRRAAGLGVSFFDTANNYNEGRSESALGLAFPEENDRTTGRRIVISTKVGNPHGATGILFSSEYIVPGAEAALQRLGRQKLDLLMLHSPSVEQLKTTDWEETFARLKTDGKASFTGISTSNHASGVYAIEHGADFLQIEFNLLDPTAQDELLPFALKHNIGIMVRLPLARGLLSGKFRAGEAIPKEQQWRRPTGETLERRLNRVEALRFLVRPDQTLAQAAIRFIIANPAVHCAIPGARTSEQLEQNLGAGEGKLTEEEKGRIAELHQGWRSEGKW